ncbi:uncharacterized protein MONBRDRAFT_12187 [Monosiga brevicollis MX1]|uniref:beta-N-acetylhexosaminidase n=1 Tax=Monosiga brevicollis TaxID=81824 RepID=A9VBH2_MONBE|nr:uncharacterized protein MONBRDRAFT_12187 [Monosiga brevicollis MX1]EDQ85099.1 predicted protein [Monosiga brevicollis MX1]|eukprot:XP_001750103.1 hypothetical protein [Monosiga brevicollis MX1]
MAFMRPRLQRTVGRYAALLDQSLRAARPLTARAEAVTVVKSILIELAIDNVDETLDLGTRYDYQVTVMLVDTSVLQVQINAITVYGAQYGLETLTQLLYNGQLKHGHVSIQDSPQYSWRSLMLDTGRRFFPVSTLEGLLDTMAANKLNVLHLHASDYCRYAVALVKPLADASRRKPKPQLPPHPALVAGRGACEFDVPGHSHGFRALAGELDFCSADQLQLFNDPGQRTLAIVQDVLQEMAALFDDPVFNVGCDETSVKGPCSLNSTFNFERQLLQTIATNYSKTPMGWEEVYFDAGAATMDTIVTAWSRHTPAEITATGRQAVEAQGSHFYFTEPAQPYPAGWTSCWYDIATGVPANETHLLLGGSMSMWTDNYCYIDQCHDSSRIPPGSTLFAPEFDAEFTQVCRELMVARRLVIESP